MIGDKSDQLSRLKSLLPRWFGDVAPLLGALLGGFAYVQAFLFHLIAYAKLQTRVHTATGGWLDLISADFFGSTLPRSTGQSDQSFRTGILTNLLRPRGTRAAVVAALESLTGQTPDIFEPLRVVDTGGYGVPTTGYSAGGRYGSALLPYQAFVTAYRPAGSGVPVVAGYGIPTGAYSTPSRSEYVNLASTLDVVTDSEIYAAIDRVKVAGTIIWTRIVNYADGIGNVVKPPALIRTPTSDSTFASIDSTLLSLDMTIS